MATHTHSQDTFTDSVESVFDVIADNSRAFLALLAILLAGAVVAAFVMKRNQVRADEARNAFYSAQSDLDSALKALDPPAPAAKPGKQGKKEAQAQTAEEDSAAEAAFKAFDVDAQLGPQVVKLKAVADNYAGTRAGFEAQMALGNLYYRHGHAEQALPWFEKAGAHASGKLEKALAREAVGYAYENSGKTADALKSYQAALGYGKAVPDALKGDLLLATARCYEAQHDTAKAKSAYDRLIGELPNSDYARTAETYVTELH